MATVNLTVSVISALMNTAEESTIIIGLPCGTKTSDNGKTSTVYARVRFAGRLSDASQALAVLAAMKGANGLSPLLKVSLPKVDNGTYTVQLSPIMRAIDFAKLCGWVAPVKVDDSKPASKPSKPASKPAAAFVGPMPADTAK